MSSLPAFQLDLTSVSRHERFDLFREINSVTHEVTQDTKSGNFGAVSNAWNLGNIVINYSRFDDCRFERSRSRLAKDGLDHYTLFSVSTGTCGGSIENREVSVEAGQVFMLDLARPISFTVTDIESVFVMIPRDVLDGMMPAREVHGLLLNSGTGTLLSGFLQLLGKQLPNFNAQEGAHIEQAVTSLIAACLAPLREREQASPTVDFTLLQRARKHIDQNLATPALTSTSICRALGISRSTLYRLFEPFAGVSAYILARRLAKAQNFLTNALDTRQISEIAYALGFLNAEHFSRAFRRSFGVSPREARGQMARQWSREPATSRTYQSWLKADR